MEIETDDMRLEGLRTLGAVCVSAQTGELEGIFDRQYIGVDIGELAAESRTPGLTCRTSDVDRLQLRKGQVIEVDGATYKIRRHEPDGTGMSVLLLDVG